MAEVTDEQRRAYLAKYGVESAITAATTKVLVKRPTDPVSEIGKCLLDPDRTVPAGKAFVPALSYVQDNGITAAVAAAVKSVVKAMPANPIQAIGAKLVPEMAHKKSAAVTGVAASLERGLSKRHTAEELHSAGILKKPVEVQAEHLQHQLAADKLHKALERRPTVDDLKEKHIYMQPVQDKAEHLAHKQAANKLEHALEKRHTVDELKESHIYKTTTVDKAEHLEHVKAKDSLHKALENRHTPKELHDLNILKSSVEDKRHHLEDVQKRASLSGMLEKRATMDELAAAGVIKSSHITIFPEYTIKRWNLAKPALDECVAATKGEADCLYYGWTICGDKLFGRMAFTTGAAAAAHLEAVGPLEMGKLLDNDAVSLDSISIMGTAKEIDEMKAFMDDPSSFGCTYWVVWDDYQAPSFTPAASLAPDSFCTLQPMFTILDKAKAEPLLAKCIAGAKTEPECLYYGWTICGDKLFNRAAHASAKGVAMHLANVGALVGQLLDEGAVKLDSIELHGPAAQMGDCKAACDALGCTYWETHPGGFKRF